jgi:hypothetical protein
METMAAMEGASVVDGELLTFVPRVTDIEGLSGARPSTRHPVHDLDAVAQFSSAC